MKCLGPGVGPIGRRHEQPVMEDMKITATGYDFRPAHAAMQAVRRSKSSIWLLFRRARRPRFGRCDLHWMGDKEAQISFADRPHLLHLLKCKADYSLRCASAVRTRSLPADDPIDRFTPQLANHRVLRPEATSSDQTEPAARPITIGHLMSHSSALSYGLFDPGTLIFSA